jgi:hypothetical protein
MRRFLLNEYPVNTVEYYIQQVPLFAELLQQDPQQFNTLMQHTSIMELEPGEVLIEKGTVGTIFYALVHGQLAIFPQKRPGEKAICELFPGQMLGALSVINQMPRTATVMVSSVEGATVLCTDYAVFGDVDDFSVISMGTKLHLFRDVVRHIRCTIQAYEVAIPDEELSRELTTLMMFAGEKDSLDEIEHLSELATALAWLLDKWNAKVTPQVPLFDESDIENKLAILLNMTRS